MVLALAGAVLVGTASTFSFMTVQLHSKVEQLDEMLLAVGKRVVDLKRRMETMDDIHASLEELNLKQENTQSVQQAIEDKISRLVDSGNMPTRKDIAAAPAEAPAPTPAKAKATAPPKPVKPAAQSNPGTKAASVKKPPAVKPEPDDAALRQQLSGLDALIK